MYVCVHVHELLFASQPLDLSLSLSLVVSGQLYPATNRCRARYKPSISNNKSPNEIALFSPIKLPRARGPRRTPRIIYGARNISPSISRHVEITFPGMPARHSNVVSRTNLFARFFEKATAAVAVAWPTMNATIQRKRKKRTRVNLHYLGSHLRDSLSEKLQFYKRLKKKK